MDLRSSWGKEGGEEMMETQKIYVILKTTKMNVKKEVCLNN